MKRISFPIALAMLSVLSLRPAGAEPPSRPPLSHVLVSQGILQSDKFAIGDCDGDRWDEIIVIGPPQEGTTDRLCHFEFYRGSLKANWQHNLHFGRANDAHVADLNQDDQAELIIARQSEDRVWAEIYDPDEPTLVLESEIIPTPDNDGSGRWDGGLIIRDCADLDGDDVLDIICSLCAGFDMTPRELVAFSGATGRVIRTFKTAGPVDKVRVVKSNKSSETIILLGTGAVNNGHCEGVFCDDKAYLCVLNTDFEFLWGNRVATYSNSWDFELIDPGSGAKPEVIFGNEMKDKQPSLPVRLEIRDIYNNITRKHLDLRMELGTVLVGDLDRDTKPEIVVTLRNGAMQLLDTDLNLLNTYLEETPVRAVWMGDLDLNGYQEIVAIRGANKIQILNSELNPIAEYEFEDRVHGVDFAQTGESSGYLVVRTDKLRLLKLRRATKELAGALKDPSLANVLFAALGLILGAGVGGWMVYRRSKVKRLSGKTLRARRMNEELLAALSAFGHSGLARKNLERIALYLDDVPEANDGRYEEYKQRISTILRRYNDFTRGLLEQIAALCSEKSEWKSSATKLQESIQTLSQLISTGDPSASNWNSIQSNAKRIASNARTILNELRFLHRSVRSIYQVDTFDTVCRVIATARERLAEQGVDRISVISRGSGPSQIDEECLKTCLEILFTNAAEAMTESDERKLEVSVGKKDGYVVIEVADAGCGIKEQDWGKIWERGVTTKGSGHGLGLYHAKQSLEKYEAKIQIKSSSPAKGTVMAIRLQAASTDSIPSAEATR